MSSLASLALYDTFNNDRSLGYSDYPPPTGIPVSTPADLARVGTGVTAPSDLYPGTNHVWSLSATYYMTNDIIFGPDDDFNGGVDIGISVTLAANVLNIRLTPPAGMTVSSISAAFDIAFVASPNTNTINLPLNAITSGEYTLGVGGMMGTEPFGFQMKIDTRNFTSYTGTFNSNGNFDPIGYDRSTRTYAPLSPAAGYVPGVSPPQAIFNGCGYTIDGVVISQYSQTDEVYAGLFAKIRNGMIINTTMGENCKISAGSMTSDVYAAGICAYGDVVAVMNAYIRDCHNKASIMLAAVGGTTTDITAFGAAILGCVEILIPQGVVNQVDIDISYCSNTGPVTSYARSTQTLSVARSYAGGIIGHLETTGEDGANPRATLYTRQCYNTGPMTALTVGANNTGPAMSFAAAIVACGHINVSGSNGELGIMQIEDCYNTGYMKADSTDRAYAAGMVGHAVVNSSGGSNNGIWITIVNTYNIGTISAVTTRGASTGAAYSGGIVSWADRQAGNQNKSVIAVLNSYYLEGTAPTLIALGANIPNVDGSSSTPARSNSNPDQRSLTSKSASQLKDPRTYYSGRSTVNNRTFDGWNYSDVWVMEEGVNDGYPVLRSSSTMTLSGKVIDIKTGNGIGGVEIYYTVNGNPPVADHSTLSMPRIISDPMGGYTINIPYGADVEVYEIYREGYKLITDDAEYPLGGSLPATVLTEGATEWNFIMTPPHFVTGQVLWERGPGDPISLPGAEIAYTVDDGTDVTDHITTTDGDGYYQIPVPHEEILTIISITRAGFLEDPSNDHNIGIVTDDMPDVDLRMYPDPNAHFTISGTISGRMLDGTIWPLDGATVSYTYTAPGGSPQTGSTPVTGNDGRYSIDVPSGSVFKIDKVEKRYGFYNLVEPDTSAFPFDPVISNIPGVNFTMIPNPDETFTVSGLIYYYWGVGDNDYTGIPNIRIVYTLDGIGDPSYHTETIDNVNPLDPSVGTYTISDVPSGSYLRIVGVTDNDEIFQILPGQLPNDLGYTTHDAEDVNFVMIVIGDEDYYIDGTVYDDNGEPIAGAEIVYVLGGVDRHSVFSSGEPGEEGTYALFLPVGTRIDIISVTKSPYKVMTGLTPDPPTGTRDPQIPYVTFVTTFVDNVNFYMEIDTSVPLKVTGEVFIDTVALGDVEVTYEVNGGPSSGGSEGTVHTVSTNLYDDMGQYLRTTFLYTIDVFAGDEVMITGVDLSPYKILEDSPSLSLIPGARDPQLPWSNDVMLNDMTADFYMEYDKSISFVVFGEVWWGDTEIPQAEVSFVLEGTSGMVKSEFQNVYHNDAEGRYIVVSEDDQDAFDLRPDRSDFTFVYNRCVYAIEVLAGDTLQIYDVGFEGLTLSPTTPGRTWANITNDIIYGFDLIPDGSPTTLTLVVVDQDGLPVVGARVSYSVDGIEYSPNNVTIVSDGHYMIDLISGNHVVILAVEHPGYVLTHIEFTSKIDPYPLVESDTTPFDMLKSVIADEYIMDVEMEVNPYTVSGTIYKDGNTVPLEGALVKYKLNDGTEVSLPATGPDGKYVIDAVYMDKVEITGVSYAGHRLMTQIPAPFADIYRNEVANFSLYEIFTVSGTVRDQAGDPLPDVTISYTLNNVSQPNIASSDGTYSITAVYGDRVVITGVVHDADGYTTVSGQTPRTFASVTANMTNVDIAMSINPYDVIGYIYDTFGNPVSGVTVTYVINGEDTGPLPSVTSGTDGKYVIELEHYDVIEIVGVTHPGFTLTTPAQIPRTHGPMTDDILTGTDYEMSVNPYDVSGYVYDTFGNPVSGVTVTYVINGEDTGPLPSVTTGTNGKYVIGLVYKDEIEIVGVTHPGFTLTTPAQIPRTHGPMTDDILTGTDYEMSVNPYDVIGHIYDTYGNPVGGATVTYVINGDDTGPLPSVTTGTDGKYVIGVIYKDEIEIVGVTHPGFTLTTPTQIPRTHGPMTSDISEGTDYEMAVNAYVIYGTVHDLVEEIPLDGVEITYRVNGGSPVTLPLTGAGGTFEISAVYLDAVSVSISKVGFKTDPAGQTMSFGPMIEDEYAEFYMSVLRFNVTIEYTGGGTVTYTLDNGTPVPITCTESGTYVINDVAYGTDIVVTVVPDDRHTSQIEDDRGLSRDSTFFSTELTGDVLLFATFTFIEDSNALIWMSLLLLLALLMIILIILLARTGLTGTVYYEGEGLEGVTVKYVMNGKERTAVTNDKGVYKIRAAVGSEITITDVSKNGYTLDQKMPRDIKYEKGTKGIDLTMSG